jgi:hypothetical protein
MDYQVAVRFALQDPNPGDEPQVRRGRKPGHHARTAGDQASLDAFAAMLRGDAAAARRHLARVERDDLAARLIPAVRRLAGAADDLLASDTCK